MTFARSALICALALSGGCARANVVPRASELAHTTVGQRDIARVEPPQVATAPSAVAPQTERSRAQLEQRELAQMAQNDREQNAYQAAQLRRTIALYRQFLERAADDPAYAPAVQRSREQIRDATAILEMLEQSASSQSGP
jgi:hypothetical protein